MKKRAIGIVVAAAFAVTVLGGPVAADAVNNGKNCIGAAVSAETPPGIGPLASALAKSGPRAVAEFVATSRDLLCD